MNTLTLPECPNVFRIKFARKLLEALGADTSIIKETWCWPDLARRFSHCKEKAEDYFAKATTGDPSWAAYCMTLDCGSTQEWAQDTIEKATTGDPSWAAYCMTLDCGSTQEWAERIIEKATTGDPPLAARCMTRYCSSTQEWADSIKPL